MKKSPSTPSSGNHETPKGSRLRMAIAFILALGAGIGLGKCVYDKKETGHPNKPKMTDTLKADAEAKKEDLSLKQCQMDLLLGVASKQCKELSEDEIKKKYLERERVRLEKRAAEIIDKLGVTNANDQEKIFKAVVAGCSELRESVGKFLDLNEPKSTDKCDEPVWLSEEIGANWIDLSHSEDYEDLTADEKKWVDLYRDKKEKELLQQINFDDIKDSINKAAQEDKNLFNLQELKEINNFFNIIEETQKNILSAEGLPEKRAIICKFVTTMHSLESADISIEIFGKTRFTLFLNALRGYIGYIDNKVLFDPKICKEDKE